MERLLLLVVVGVLGSFAQVYPDFFPEEYVNILGGTDSYYDLSRGNTLPLITVPWGFNSYAPQTDDDPNFSGWWFHPSDHRFFGLRVTHQPSPWINDYGQFLMKAYMPTDPTSSDAHQDQFVGFSSDRSTYNPYYFKTELYQYANNNGMLEIEFAPTSHGGIFKATYPAYIKLTTGDQGKAYSQIRRISASLGKHQSCSFDRMSDGAPMLYGFSTESSGGTEAPMKHFFVMAIYKGKYGNEIPVTNSTKNGQECWVDFDPAGDNDELTVRLGTSFISHTQALSNLLQEVNPEKKQSVHDILEEAKREWSNTLSRVAVHEQMENVDHHEATLLLTTFYSSMYRASVFPRQIGEWDVDQQKWVHWSPYIPSHGTQPQEGYLSTDSGFWDAWNTVYPLMSLAYRPQLGITIQGWLNAYKEGGWLPKWASPGYRGSMIGTMGDVVLSSAIVNRIPGFDTDLAYEAVRKDAFVTPPEGKDGVGRVCLESYSANGYVATGANMTTGGQCYEIVSRSLNYYQSDYAVSQAADVLGHTDDKNTLLARSKNYSKLFDGYEGFFRSKTEGARYFNLPFDQYAWGGDYTEGGPWQYRFYVPYDPEGLESLYTKAGLNYCQLLEKVQTISPSVVHIGGYYTAIHEQTELVNNCWGQYAHNNQPIHHQLFMTMVDGVSGTCANMGRKWIRKTLLRMHKADADMFPGDEDNGEMGAWFVLSALGLYSRSPSSGVYQFTSPIFSKVEINISDLAINPNPNTNNNESGASRHLVIEAVNNTLKNSKIQEVHWNGVKLDDSANGIQYTTLAEGGTLTYYMGPQ